MSPIVWFVFLLFVVAMVILDLGLFHRKAREQSIRESLAWTGVWIALALVFSGVVYFLYGGTWQGGSLPDVVATGRAAGASPTDAVVQFLTGYLVEKSLSIDNLFVIAMIFGCFGIPLAQQHRLLFWGILGAVVLRGIMIAVGTVLIEQFTWVIYVFGLLLLASAVKLLRTHNEAIHPERNLAVRLVRRFYPVSATLESDRFFVSDNGVTAVTPLLLALVLIETSDVMFAVDSIPAVFAVTRDPFLVFTSNVFAILGMRSMYFALAGLMDRFRHLKTSLVIVLSYIGVKMLLSHRYPIPNGISLSIIGAILGTGLFASWWNERRCRRERVPIGLTVRRLAGLSLRQARKAVVLVVGGSTLAAGIAMIVLPGPAIVVIPLALSILAIEFAWARRWLKHIQATAGLGQPAANQPTATDASGDRPHDEDSVDYQFSSSATVAAAVSPRVAESSLRGSTLLPSPEFTAAARAAPNRSGADG